MISKIWDYFTSKKTLDKDEEKNTIEVSGNMIVIQLDSSTGDVVVFSRLENPEKYETLEIMTHFLALLKAGDLSPLFLQSIKQWAITNGGSEKKQFVDTLELALSRIGSKIEVTESQPDDVAVKASQVFNFLKGN